LLADRPPRSGWADVSTLVWFALHLALQQRDQLISQCLYDALQSWINQQGADFALLNARVVAEAPQRPAPSAYLCQHLMVAIELEGGSTQQVRVSIWPVADREQYDLNRPAPSVALNELLDIRDLPAFIQKKRKGFRKVPTPVVHLFAPRLFFSRGLELGHCDRFGRTLGEQYPFVLRTNLKAHPIGYYYYDDWHDKWAVIEEAFHRKAGDISETVDCLSIDRALIETLEEIQSAVLENCSDVVDFFEQVAENTALPVALWVRDEAVQARLVDVLESPVEQLAERIRQARETAQRSEEKELLGHHLSLMWEDPKIVPPDMQFDPEAC
ncbi:MAG: hypothetical protein ABG776_01250, partial [Cyanobacteria bacterium J06555_13]